MSAWLLTLLLLTATPTQAAPDWDAAYDRAATVGLVSGVTAPIVPPAASAVTFAILKERMGPAPNLLEPCGAGGIGGVICLLLLPVLVVGQIVATYVWVVLPLARTFIYTSPLYAVGPPILAASAMRGRRALNELGHDVPGTWGVLSYGFYGIEMVGLVGTSIGLNTSGGGSVTLPLAIAGWTGSLTSGLLQWRVNRRHHRGTVGSAPPAERRRMNLPTIQVGGRF